MHIKDIPSFLLTSPHSSDDRRRLFSELQLWCLWREANGTKPFDRSEALRLQVELRAQHQLKMQKQAHKEAIEREKARIELQEVCRKVGETVMVVKIFGEAHSFGKNVKCPITNEKFGSPREFLDSVSYGGVFDWSLCGDPRRDVEGFVDNLKKRFDGFNYRFSLPRKIRDYKQDGVFKEVPENFIFTLTLHFTPFHRREILSKVRKIVKNH